MTPELFDRITRGYPLFMTSLPDIPGGGFIKEAVVTTAEEAQQFIRQYGKPGQSVYHCATHLKKDATRRCKENVEYVSSVWCDIDFKNHIIPPDEIERRISLCRLPPTRVNHTGGGLHCFWDFHDPIRIDSPTTRSEMEGMLRALAKMTGGDTAVCDAARLMRVVGSTNWKHGEPRVVQNKVFLPGAYEPEELGEWLSADGPVMPAPAAAPGKNEKDHNERASVPVNSFAQAFQASAEAAGERVPYDVEDALENMTHGEGATGVNGVQIRTALSQVQRGVHPDEILKTLLAVSMKAGEGKGWNEEVEVRNIHSRAIGTAYTTLCEERERSGEWGVPHWVTALGPEAVQKWADTEALGNVPRVKRGPYGYYVYDYSKFCRGQQDRWQKAAQPNGHADPAAEVVTPPPRKYRFKLISFADMQLGDDPLYRVEELLPMKGLVDIWGKAKSYKSFWTFNLMFHTARGMTYHGRRVKQGTVCYMAFEGGFGYRKRVAALRQHYKIPPDEHIPLYIMPGSADLVKDHVTLIAEIRAQLGEDAEVSVVVLDTLNRSFVGSESKDTDMGAYVRAAVAIQEAFNCCVCIVHHCGLDETRPRGHTSLPGAVDCQISITREGDIVVAEVEMMRDGPDGSQDVCRVEEKQLGPDAFGKEQTSLVVLPATEEDMPDTNVTTVSQSVFEKALFSALNAHGQLIVISADAGAPVARAVRREDVRKKFEEIYPADGDTEDKRRGARRTALSRAITLAQKAGTIGVRVFNPTPDGQTATFLWPTDPTLTRVQVVKDDKAPD